MDRPTDTSNATLYIITILVKYQKLSDTQLHQKDRHEILNELLHINAAELIDNFNTTINESISNNFETIYQMILNQINPNQTSSYISSSCNSILCKMIQRNNRDIMTKHGISNIYYNIKDDTKIEILQLLDTIHCYFMHRFDFGLKFTKNEINCIHNVENKTEDNNNKLNGVLVSSPATNLFTFGTRWRGSKKYKNNTGIDKMNIGKYNQCFVSQKYTNLKCEMLSNSIKKISMQQWLQINAKSENYLKCNKIKLLHEFDDSIPNIAENQSISLQHIICILIYCNFSSIKNSLIDTYNTMNKFEEWKDVRGHSEFANFGRILTETVECFGDNVRQQNINNKQVFYHTILGTFELHSIDNTLNIDRYGNGFIIDENINLSSYFNCSFIIDISICIIVQ